MADITLGYVPTNGGATTASGYNGDLYTPTARTSFETINGWVDRDNRASAWKVSWDKVRPGSMALYEGVGATANLDYFPPMFPQDATVNGAYMPIPGAAQVVYAKRATGIILVSGQITIANSMGSDTTNGAKLRLFRRAPGGGAVALAGSFQQVATGETGAFSATDVRRVYRDRQYAFHYLDINPAVGEYRYYVGLWFTGAVSITITDGAPLPSAPSARVRCRNMTTQWIG